jgi:hypothetical protein
MTNTETFKVQLDLKGLQWMNDLVIAMNKAHAAAGPTDWGHWSLPDEIPVWLEGEPSGYVVALSDFTTEDEPEYAIFQEHPNG